MSARFTTGPFRICRPASMAALAISTLCVCPNELTGQSTPPWADSLYALLNADLARVVADQQRYFASHQTYASDLTSLGCETSPGVTLGIVVSPTAFSLAATHGALGLEYGCAVYQGDIAPPTYPARPSGPGKIACTTGAPPVPQALIPPPVPEGPVYVPHDVAPTIRNPEELRSSLVRMYPRDLRENWIGGTAELALFVCDRGTVQQVVLARSSGHDRLDQVAISVAQTIMFRPAEKDGAPVGVWVTVPITFQAKDQRIR